MVEMSTVTMGPELYLLTGVLLVIGSLIGLAIAFSVRHWFFTPDARPQPVRVAAHDTHGWEARQGA